MYEKIEADYFDMELGRKLLSGTSGGRELMAKIESLQNSYTDKEIIEMLENKRKRYFNSTNIWNQNMNI